MENTNLLKTSLSEFKDATELYLYIKNYLINSGVVAVADIDESIKSRSGMEHIFTVDFMNQYEPNGTQKRYYAFVCPLEDDLKNLISKIQTGLNSVIPYRKVAVGYFNYDSNTKSMANAIGLELLGYSDILEINNAIDSASKGLPYLSLNNNFTSALAKNLNAKFKFAGGNTFTSEINTQFSGLSEAINDGFNQLKGSLGTLFNRGNKNNKPSGFNGGMQQNQWTAQQTQSEQQNQWADQSGQVEYPENKVDSNENKTVNLNKEPEQVLDDNTPCENKNETAIHLDKEQDKSEGKAVSLKKE